MVRVMTTALVTGGTRGLGRALAEDLARDGWHVIIDGRDREVLARTAGEIGCGVEAIAGDVSDTQHRAQLAAAVKAGGGRLDLLVNNASILGPSPLPQLRDHPLDALEEVLRVNV